MTSKYPYLRKWNKVPRDIICHDVLSPDTIDDRRGAERALDFGGVDPSFVSLEALS